MRGVVEEIRARGAELVLVGNGSLEEARRFSEEQRLSSPLYTDPSLEAYRCAELRHGLASTLSPRVIPHALKALTSGFRQTSTQGSALQQGGAFVIARGGKLLFEHTSREAGDHPDVVALLKALDERKESGPLSA